MTFAFKLDISTGIVSVLFQGQTQVMQRMCSVTCFFLIYASWVQEDEGEDEGEKDEPKERK